MAILRPEPDLCDVEGWQRLVEELRADPEDDASPTMLFCAEVHLAAISLPPEDTLPETA